MSKEVPAPSSVLSGLFGPVISSYTRAQAIDDGTLVDVSESDSFKELGFRFPIALTRAVWDLCVELSPAAKRACNDEMGRLHDVLYMLRARIRNANAKGGPCDRMTFEILCVTTRVRPSVVQLVAVCGPGDTAEPVITVMLPSED